MLFKPSGSSSINKSSVVVDTEIYTYAMLRIFKNLKYHEFLFKVITSE